MTDTRSDGPALDPWDNLPPHLQEDLRDAFEGLRGAFEDTTHPLMPQLRKLWQVADEIEQWVLAQEASQPRDATGRSVEGHAAQETSGTPE